MAGNEQNVKPDQLRSQADDEPLFGDPTQYQDAFDEADSEPVISWQASEYIHHQKSIGWFAAVIVFFVALAAALFFIYDGDFSIIVLLAVMTVALIVYANRPPRTLNYSLSNSGLQVGDVFYSFGQFRSFSVMQQGSMFSIELDSLQRFRPGLSVFFSPQDGDTIIDILANYLPIEEHQPDIVDRFIRFVRF